MGIGCAIVQLACPSRLLSWYAFIPHEVNKQFRSGSGRLLWVILTHVKGSHGFLSGDKDRALHELRMLFGR